MFSKFTEEAQKVLVNAKKEMTSLKHPYVGSEHLLLAILKNKTCDITRQLFEFGLDYKKFQNEVLSIIGYGKEKTSWYLYTPLLKRILEGAMLEAKENNEEEVTIEHLFLSLLEEGEGVAIRILLGMGIDLDELYQSFSNKFTKKNNKKSKKLMVEEFSIDFNQRFLKGDIDPVVGREEELSRIIEILTRRMKNNPLLIGEAGVGKTAIVEELARRIVLDSVPESLRGKRVLSLSIAGLVAGTKYRGEFEERVNKLLKEVEENQEIIIFVDEIHTLIGAGGAEGAIDASNILKPILARGKIRLIGATTTDEYKKFIEKDKAFARRFQTVLVEEPNDEKTYQILCKLKPLYEGYHRVILDDELLHFIISLSNRYLFDRQQPDKSIDLLDEVCAKVALCQDDNLKKMDYLKSKYQKVQDDKTKAIMNQNFKVASELRVKERKLEDKINRLETSLLGKKEPKKVTKKFIMEVVQSKTKIPIYDMNLNQNYQFLDLQNELSKEVLGQEEAIKELCLESKRIQFGLSQDKKPVSFLFVGKTGIGKTKLVKEYAKRLVGEEHFIRLDMSEYRENHSISKIIGAPPGYVGYTEHNSVLEQIRTFPYSILLLDEIEKAHPSVVQLFLQALDEGKMKTSTGMTVHFDHVTIFMTSNIGCTKEEIGFYENKKSSIMTKLKEILSIEFLNRIDHVLLFKPMTKEIATLIIEKELNSMIDSFQKRGISVSINKIVKQEILDLCQYEQFGARKIPSIIHKKLDTIIIDRILAGKNDVYVHSLLTT